MQKRLKFSTNSKPCKNSPLLSLFILKKVLKARFVECKLLEVMNFRQPYCIMYKIIISSGWILFSEYRKGSKIHQNEKNVVTPLSLQEMTEVTGQVCNLC